MLAFGKVDHNQILPEVSPWVDAKFTDIEHCAKLLESQRHQRFFKTHTPFDGLPYYEDSIYLVVFRDPRDVYVSIRNHRENVAIEELATLLPGGENAFADWLSLELPPGSWDQVGLAPLCTFIQSYWLYRHLPNVHLFHYAEMKQDLSQQIKNMANACGIELDDSQIKTYANAVSFSRMQANANQYVPDSGIGMWKDESRFFASGENGQWESFLSDSEKAAFESRFAELVSDPELADWVFSGGR
jgi:hypothetical protein